MADRWGKSGNSGRLYFLGTPKSLRMDAAALKLLHGKKSMANLDSVLKSTGITLPTKVHPVKAMVFSTVMYGCEYWTLKKAEHRRIVAFVLGIVEDS